MKVCKPVCDAGLYEYKEQCLSKCPPEMPYARNGTCRKDCMYYDRSNQCFDSCPKYFIRDTGGRRKCVSECPTGYKLNGTECVDQCHNYTYIAKNGGCTNSCPSNSYIEENGLKVCTNCSLYLLEDEAIKRCVTMCPEGYYVQNDECIK